jgi:hypothetical protein
MNKIKIIAIFLVIFIVFLVNYSFDLNELIKKIFVSSTTNTFANNEIKIEQEFPNVIINGKINNYEKYKNNFVVVKAWVENLLKSRLNYPSYIDENGLFLIKFNIKYQQDIYLKYGNKQITLFIQPNDSLYLNIDASLLFTQGINNNSISISGTSEEINFIFLDYVPKFYSFILTNYPGRERDPDNKANKLSASEYKSYLYKRIQKNKVFLNDYISKNKIENEVFAKWATIQIEYRCIDAMLDYRRHYAGHNGIQDSDVKIPEDYYDFLKQYPLDNPENLICHAYKSYLSDYVGFSFKKFAYENNMKFDDTFRIEFIKSLLKQEESLIRDLTVSKIFYVEMARNFELIEPHYETYLATVENEICKNIVTEKYNSLYGKTISKNIPFDVNLNDFFEKDSLLKEILHTHENKVIYIDFWATWCGPCRKEFPHSKEI